MTVPTTWGGGGGSANGGNFYTSASTVTYNINPGTSTFPPAPTIKTAVDLLLADVDAVCSLARAA